MLQGLRSKFYGSRLYDFSLGGRPVSPSASPPSLWSKAITSRATENDFHWLGALNIPNDPLDIGEARHRLLAWWNANWRWRSDTWRADLIGDRLTHLLIHFDALHTDAPDLFKSRLKISLNRQARHLFRIPLLPRTQADAFKIWRGRVFAALFLPKYRPRLVGAVGEMIEGIPGHIFPDGGHFSRSPQMQLECLAALVHIRATLEAVNAEVPEVLQGAIDRMTPMVRTFLHADGALAAFNASDGGDTDAIVRVLEMTRSRAKPTSSAPHTGFHRISAQRTLILFESGVPADSAPLVCGHAGTLSFEMSVGPHRMIVNCGSVSRQDNTTLAEALRATAAHSTLTIADVHSSDIEAGGGFGKRRARNVTVRRREQDRNVLVEAAHDGYLQPFGMTHRRSLYLARDGLDLRGEDILEAETGSGRTFDIRFHLHPKVRASLAEGGRSALLRLSTGRGWRLTVSDGVLGMEESIYAGDRSSPCPTTQIVIRGRHARRQTMVKWRLAREG
jgi:uncharacterized heparinase superfamily protein